MCRLSPCKERNFEILQGKCTCADLDLNVIAFPLVVYVSLSNGALHYYYSFVIELFFLFVKLEKELHMQRKYNQKLC